MLFWNSHGPAVRFILGVLRLLVGVIWKNFLLQHSVTRREESREGVSGLGSLQKRGNTIQGREKSSPTTKSARERDSRRRSSYLEFGFPFFRFGFVVLEYSFVSLWIHVDLIVICCLFGTWIAKPIFRVRM